MNKTFRIGRLLGFPVEVNVTFLLLLAVVLLFTGGVSGLLLVLLAFASVLVHELGHALVARRLGVRVAGIELHFFGGAAKIVDAPRSPRDEIYIAAAGPAVSLALAVLGIGLAVTTGLRFFALLGWTNLVIGVFNLVPALPMDGGRILRALLTPRRGHLAATEIAVSVARVFAVALGALGVTVGHYQLALLAVVLWAMGTAERRAARLRHDSLGAFDVGPDPFFGGRFSGERAAPPRPGVVEAELLPRGVRPGTPAARAGRGMASPWPTVGRMVRVVVTPR